MTVLPEVSTQFETIFQSLVYTRTYARWIQKQQRREYWPEGVARYIGFLREEIVLKKGLPVKSLSYVLELLAEAEQEMLALGVVGSMRALWTAGKALKIENACAYNCFSPDTPFVTSEGVRRFSEFSDGDKVMALSNGSFKEATVKKFGQESTLQLVVGKGKSLQTFHPTAGHRWITQEKCGTGVVNVVKTTDELKVGDVLKRSPKRGKEIIPCPIGIMHGIVFGDGSLQGSRSHIVLCDSKHDLLPYFTTGATSGVKGRTRISGLPLAWKELPNSFQDPSYLLGFLIGWFSVDGTIGVKGNNIAITNGNKENLEWFRDAASVLGIFCKNITGGDRPNPFDESRTAPLFKIEVHGDSLPSNFFIRDYAKYRFAQRKVKLEWKVKSVTPMNNVSDVWCLQVPETESFALGCGIETKNCAYTTIEHYKDFAEILYLLMCGCGVSYSAERQFICKLRPIPMLEKSDKVVVFRDSKKGWAKGYYEFISHLLKGSIPKYDLSKIRKKGMILKTFGGRSSGPEPLRDLLIFTTRLFDRTQGGKLTSEDVSDLVCKIADIVVVGGARRSATLALTNPSDRRMAEYKKGDYFKDHKYRSMVNVSSCYTDAKKPGVLPFLEDFTHLIESKSGERGFVNRVALNKSMETLGRPHSEGVGVNPCGEIILRPKGFCNLSEIIVRDGDTLDILKRKAKLATVLGFLQSLLNDFNFISSKWKQNCIEDRILGLSLTGLRDHAVLGVTGDEAEGWLDAMYYEAHTIESRLAKLFGIEPAKAITCVKPSGCRPAEALVTTQEGIFTLEELLCKFNNPSSNWADVEGITAVDAGAITKTYINGKARTNVIKLEFGMELESTPNHQWWVEGKGFIRTDSIQEGDVIRVKVGGYCTLEDAKLIGLNPKAINCREDASDVRQPSTMSPDLAWLLGYLWGDGAMSPGRYRIRFTDEVTENLEKVKSILKKVFGIEAKYCPASEGRKCFSLDVANKILWHWLIKNDVWKYYAEGIDVIPRVVRCSSTESIISFIAGMIDADGWSKGGKLVFTTHEKMFGNHFQQVALAVGLAFGRSHNTKGDSFAKTKSMYLMHLLQYSTKEALELLKKHCIKANQPLIAENERKNNYRVLGKVKGCEPGRVVSTFDVETESHWFYAGAFESHNTVSQLMNSASGLHVRYAKQYIRRMRIAANDPLAKLLIAQGMDFSPENGETYENARTYVFSFPIEAPHSSVVKADVTAVQQLDYWKMLKTSWCDHNPSCTVYVRDNEWVEVASWVYANFDILGGISFLPDDNSYDQAPYEEITHEEYISALEGFPIIDLTKLSDYEKEDYTTGAQEAACSGGNCELN